MIMRNKHALVARHLNVMHIIETSKKIANELHLSYKYLWVERGSIVKRIDVIGL
jgi:hypothetical protein